MIELSDIHEPNIKSGMHKCSILSFTSAYLHFPFPLSVSPFHLYNSALLQSVVKLPSVPLLLASHYVYTSETRGYRSRP
jgi:hypothetical protein